MLALRYGIVALLFLALVTNDNCFCRSTTTRTAGRP
jgi:hypothetical protein